jgi:hypothetical protein
MKGIRQEQSLIGELKFSHKRWACQQKSHQFPGMQVKYSLISLPSRDCLTTLRQGQPILPVLGIRPVENVRKRDRENQRSAVPPSDTQSHVWLYLKHQKNYIFHFTVWHLLEGKRYISNEAKGHYKLGVYFPITLRNEPNKNCILDAKLKMN